VWLQIKGGGNVLHARCNFCKQEKRVTQVVFQPYELRKPSKGRTYNPYKQGYIDFLQCDDCKDIHGIRYTVTRQRKTKKGMVPYQKEVLYVKALRDLRVEGKVIEIKSMADLLPDTKIN